jgi:hypothetical protein
MLIKIPIFWEKVPIFREFSPGKYYNTSSSSGFEAVAGFHFSERSWWSSGSKNGGVNPMQILISTADQKKVSENGI